METLNIRATQVKPILLRAAQVNRPIFIWGPLVLVNQN